MTACRARKVSHQTQQEAQAAAARMGEQLGIVTFLRAYRCRCGAWHVGKSRNIDWSKVK